MHSQLKLENNGSNMNGNDTGFDKKFKILNYKRGKSS